MSSGGRGLGAFSRDMPTGLEGRCPGDKEPEGTSSSVDNLAAPGGDSSGEGGISSGDKLTALGGDSSGVGGACSVDKPKELGGSCSRVGEHRSDKLVDGGLVL